MAGTQSYRKWLTYGTCVWAGLFAAPHTWWALGVSAGFPGGEESYRLMFSSVWRYLYDVLVVVLSGVTVVISITLLRSSGRGARWWILRTVAWIGAVMLLVRGVAGMIVDGTSDLIWWPTFLLGGMLLSSVAWLARKPERSTAGSLRS